MQSISFSKNFLSSNRITSATCNKFSPSWSIGPSFHVGFNSLKISGGNGSMNRPIVKFQKDGDRRVDSVIGRPTFIGHVHPSRYLFFDLDTYRIMQYANEHLLSQPGCTNTGSGQLHAPITQTILTTPAFIDNHLRSSPS